MYLSIKWVFNKFTIILLVFLEKNVETLYRPGAPWTRNYSKSIIRSKTLFTENYFEFRKKKLNIGLEIHTRNMYTKFGANRMNRNRDNWGQKMSSYLIIIIIIIIPHQHETRTYPLHSFQ